MVRIGTEKGVRSCQVLPPGTTWGPFSGKIERSTRGNDVVRLFLMINSLLQGKRLYNVSRNSAVLLNSNLRSEY